MSCHLTDMAECLQETNSRNTCKHRSVYVVWLLMLTGQEKTSLSFLTPGNHSAFVASAESKRRVWWRQTYSLVFLQLNPKALQTKKVCRCPPHPSRLSYITAEGDSLTSSTPPTLSCPSVLAILPSCGMNMIGWVFQPLLVHVITVTPLQVQSRLNILAESM